VKIIALLARHFLLRLALAWVEVRIRLVSAFIVHLLRLQLRLVRFSGVAFLAILALLVTGCASAPKPTASYAPSSAGVLRAVTSAKTHAVALRSEVTTPAGLRALDDLHTSLDASISEVAAYSAKVDDLSMALIKAEESSTYWKAKHQKSLRELWIWRGLAALTLASLAGWLSLRMGFKFAL
jgi:hypothetical protein